MDAKKRGRPTRKATTEVEAPAETVSHENGTSKKKPAAKGKTAPAPEVVDPQLTVSPEKKKGGRKAAAKPAAVEVDPLELETAPAEEPVAPVAKKGRKPAAAAAAKEPEPVEEPAAKKGRGRKPAENGTSSPVAAAPAPKGKPGRKGAAAAPVAKEVVEEQPEPAKRGRGKAKAEPEPDVAASPAKKSKPAPKEATPKKAAASPKKAAPEVSEEAPKEAKGGRGRKKAAPVEEKPASPVKSPAAAAAPGKRGRKKATAESEAKPVEKTEKVKKTSKKAAPVEEPDETVDGAAASTAAATEPVNGVTQRKKKKAEAGDDEPKAKKNKAAAAPKMNKSATDYSKLSFAHDGEFNLKISSWNVAGLRSWIEKGGLEYLDHEAPDVLCLQETKCTEDQLPEQARHIKGYHPYWLCKPGGYAGVAIYSKKMPINVSYGLGDAEQDEDGRLLTAEYEKFYLVCVYVPNAGRKLVTLPKRMRWDEKFQKYLRDLDAKKPVILCGDMNVAHEEIDLANPKTNKKNAGFTQEERDGMSKLLSFGFVDTYRKLYPAQKAAYTFWTYMGNARSKNVGWRLDYFITSERLENRVVDNVIRTGVYGSDHCPITLLLNL